MSKTYDLFEQGLKILRSKTEGVSDARKVVLGVLVLLHVAAHMYETVSRDGTDQDRADLRADILKAFRDLCSEIDLPGVPDFTEPLIDNVLEAALLKGMDTLHDQINEIHDEIDALLKGA